MPALRGHDAVGLPHAAAPPPGTNVPVWRWSPTRTPGCSRTCDDFMPAFFSSPLPAAVISFHATPGRISAMRERRPIVRDPADTVVETDIATRLDRLPWG